MQRLHGRVGQEERGPPNRRAQGGGRGAGLSRATDPFTPKKGVPDRAETQKPRAQKGQLGGETVAPSRF